jgi:hypothetical protein
MGYETESCFPPFFVGRYRTAWPWLPLALAARSKYRTSGFCDGTLGEIYLLLTFGFQITTRRIFNLFVSHLHI